MENSPIFSAFSTGEQAPGDISRMEGATGLLVRGVLINGHYLIAESCDVNTQQEIKMRRFVQGGPREAISDIGKKVLRGQIVCPVRVDRSGNLEPAIHALLQNAEQPIVPLRIDTNHILTHPDLTVDDPGTSNNQLITLDCVMVEKLTLSLKNEKQGGLTLTADLIGMQDARDPADLIDVPNDYLLGNQIAWKDCDASRFESAMRTVSSVEFVIENGIDAPVFLLPKDGISIRSDQPALLGVKSCSWHGSVVEMVRRGVDVETYIHGGAMVGEDLTLDFNVFSAVLHVPLFEAGQQPLTASIMKRTTKFWVQNAPTINVQLFFYATGS